MPPPELPLDVFFFAAACFVRALRAARVAAYVEDTFAALAFWLGCHLFGLGLGAEDDVLKGIGSGLHPDLLGLGFQFFLGQGDCLLFSLALAEVECGSPSDGNGCLHARYGGPLGVRQEKLSSFVQDPPDPPTILIGGFRVWIALKISLETPTSLLLGGSEGINDSSPDAINTIGGTALHF